jgi:CRP-like cAMP-binding protein|tara:strand:- start:723 stop:1226 length:504 start_codon:yes stop_codon:yes gene_type:complete
MKNEQLKNYKIFENLTDNQIEKFRPVLNKKEVDGGNKFIVEGDEGNSIYLLLNGEAEINQALTLSVNKSDSDKREKSIMKLTDKDFPQFGEMSIFSEGDVRTANVRAQTDCTLAKIDKEDLFKICNDNPEIGFLVMRNLGRIITKNLVKANQNVLKLTTAFSLILDR